MTANAEIDARDLQAALSEWVWKDEHAPSLSRGTQGAIARFVAGWLAAQDGGRDMSRGEVLMTVLAEHAPVNASHHMGRFANGSDSYTSILCKHQGTYEPFMSAEHYRAHLAVMLENALATQAGEQAAVRAQAAKVLAYIEQDRREKGPESIHNSLDWQGYVRALREVLDWFDRPERLRAPETSDG